MKDHEYPSDNHDGKPADDELNWAELERTEVDAEIDTSQTSATVPPANQPPKKGKKILIIILAIVGSLLILAGLTFFLYNQFATANLTSEEKIEKTTDQAELKKLYDELLSSYATSGKSEAEILALLERAAKETGDQSYLTNKDSYLVKKPSFNLAPGTYEGTQNLEIIKGNAGDAVYYTIDGSVPNQTSAKYTSAIPLPIGETTVKAMAVSAKGFSSSVIEGQYILTSPQITTQSVLSEEDFINRFYGVWYRPGTENVLTISQTTYREYIPTPLSVASGDYVVVSTTENGGTIKVLNFTVDGYNAGDTLIEFDFGTPGDNQMRLRHEGKSWWDYTAAEYLGGGEYRIPFEFAGKDVFTLD